jgi:hypothetical protein
VRTILNILWLVLAGIWLAIDTRSTSGSGPYPPAGERASPSPAAPLRP